jgi:uncharacterized protein DUF4129
VHDDDLREGSLQPLSPRRLLGTLAGAVVLIVLVVVASRGDRPGGGSHGSQAVSTVLVNVALLVLAIVAAALLVTALLSVQPVKQGRPKPRTGPRLLGQLVAAIVVVALLVGAVNLLTGRNGQGRARLPGSSSAGSALQSLEKRSNGSWRTVDWLPVVLVFGGAVVAFGALGVAMLRRRPLLPDGEAALSDELSALFDETLHDLRAETDPRRAVIGSYARMERILGRRGLPRRPSEAPHEYVARVLEDLVASGSSVRRLTRLFERARFSPHDVDPQMKEEAITAVAAVRDELRAREAEAQIAVPH